LVQASRLKAVAVVTTRDFSNSRLTREDALVGLFLGELTTYSHRFVPFVILAVACVLLGAAPAGAAGTPVYLRGLVFAFVGTECPNGSARLDDEVYQKAGALSGVTYCSFRSAQFLYPEPCPKGFRQTGSVTRGDQALKECSAVGVR
jgi:hypothetical protein